MFAVNSLFSPRGLTDFKHFKGGLLDRSAYMRRGTRKFLGKFSIVN